MYDIEYKYGCTRIGVILVSVILLVFGVYWVLEFYTNYPLVIFVIIGMVSILCLIRVVGLSLLYPGNLCLSKSLCLRIDNETLLSCIHRELKCLCLICDTIENWVEETGRLENLLADNLEESLRNELSTIGKENEKKGKLERGEFREREEVIEEFEEILGVISKEVLLGSDIKISYILKDPEIIIGISEECLEELKAVSKEIRKCCVQLWKKIQENYIPEFPQLDQEACKVNNKFEVAKWDLMGKKLFTMESFYSFWDSRFEYHRFVVETSGGKEIEAAIIYSIKCNNSNTPSKLNIEKSSVLYSNPNGAYFQCMSTTLLEFYLSLNMNIILWNYRGYSNSTGYSTIAYCLEDIRAVYKYVLKNYNLKVEILHGTSIGGLCAVDLAHEIGGMEGRIKLIIADRTFGGIDLVAKGFVKGSGAFMRFLRGIAPPLVRFLFPYDCFDNGKKFIECECDKVCIWDSKDEIINNEASLKSSIYKRAVSDIEYLEKVIDELETDNEVQLSERRSEKSNILLVESNTFTESIMEMERVDKIVYEKVCRVLFDTDGGGERLYMKINESSDEILTLEEIKLSYDRYFIGLCLFGCRSRGDFADESSHIETQNRLKRRMELISELGESVKENKVYCHIESLNRCLSFAYNQSSEEIVNLKESKYGKLIVSHIGHNANLTSKHLFVLKRIIEKSVFQESSSMNQMVDKKLLFDS